jgi:succinyl-CoA synthetase alpha subunit
LYEQDEETDAVVIIGELGGTMEEEVADAIKQGRFTKPLVAFLGGRTAPKGQKMGHAGAIVTGGKGSVEDKIEALTSVGALVAERPRLVGEYLEQLNVKKA